VNVFAAGTLGVYNGRLPMNRRAAFIFILLFAAAGCATTGAVSGGGAKIQPAPPVDPKSLLTLEQIPPPVSMPKPRPATRPGVPPPSEALALYAAARDATLDGRPMAAIDLLRQAIALDPDSFELYRAMGEARLAAARRPNQEEIDAFEKAAELRPDDLRLQALLGAQCAALGQVDKSMLHLRLAVLTSDYVQDDVAGAAVDLLLARLLQIEGYDRAALGRYEILLQRLASPSYDLRNDPELGGLAADPKQLNVEIGFLHEKHGEWQKALENYAPLADADPSNFDLQAKVVRMLSNLGRGDEAIRKAADLVMRFDASSDAQDLLKEVCRQQNQPAAESLARLRAEHPSDTSLLLALAQALADDGDEGRAQTLLESAHSSDERVTGKLFDLYLQRAEVSAAARLLIVYVAAHPDALGQVEPWWLELTDATHPNTLRLNTLERVDVDPSATAAKEFFVWRLATNWRRDVLARSALDQAVHAWPPFAPAYRQLVIDDWSRPDWDEARREKESEHIAKLAEQDGDAALAAEVRGLAAASSKQPAEAITHFEQAIALGDSSSQLVLTYAIALRDNKQDAKAEGVLRDLVGRQPQFDQAWEALFQFYLAQQAVDPARKVLSDWLTADPASVSARVLQADLAAEDGDNATAEAILLKILTDHPDDADVISALVGLGKRTGRLDQFVTRLEELRRRQPTDSALAEWLVDIYADQGRTTDAIRVLDQTRQAVAKDPDLLYNIAHLYERVDQKQTTEEVLRQVVALDPNNASACNDLGYTWADEGRNLPRAESLIRVAVGQEPDNQSFLDSMGWVLYKQGRYADAEVYFKQALAPSAEQDPVVQDHFGDVLYRLNRLDDAAAEWQKSLGGLDQQPADRDDLRDLRLSLLKKLSQRKDGLPVSVAPVGGDEK
jgi:predicted Zn-dependent protease